MQNTHTITGKKREVYSDMRKDIMLFAASLLALSLLGVSVAAQASGSGLDGISTSISVKYADTNQTATVSTTASPEPESTREQASATPVRVRSNATRPLAAENERRETVREARQEVKDTVRERLTAARVKVLDAEVRVKEARAKFLEVQAGRIRGEEARLIARENVAAQLDQLQEFARWANQVNSSKDAEDVDRVINESRDKILNATNREDAKREFDKVAKAWVKAKAAMEHRQNLERMEGLRGVEMKLKEIGNQVNLAIAHIKARGVDTSSVESKLAECRAKLNATRPLVTEARTLLGGTSNETAEQKEADVEKAKEVLQEANGDVKDAHSCFKDALDELRSAAKDAAGKPTVKPVVTPTAEPEDDEATPTATVAPTVSASPTVEPTATTSTNPAGIVEANTTGGNATT